MQPRRKLLKMMGTGSLATAGLFGAGISAADSSSSPNVELDSVVRNFVTIDITIRSSPEDSVPVDGQDSKGYLSTDRAIYLQGNTSTYEPSDESQFLTMINGGTIVSLHESEQQPIAKGRRRISSGQSSFIGSYGDEIEVSTDRNLISLHIGGKEVMKTKPNQTTSIEHEMEITYSNDNRVASRIETPVTFDVKHMGDRKIISHPSSKVIPKDHRLGMYARRALNVQEGASQVARDRVEIQGRNYIKTENGFIRIVPAPNEKSFVLEKTADWEINGGSQ